MSTLKLLLTNVLYRGDISHKGTVYPGEHEAIVSRELWVEVNGNLRLSRTGTRSHVQVSRWLETLCAGRAERRGLKSSGSFGARSLLAHRDVSSERSRIQIVLRQAL